MLPKMLRCTLSIAALLLVAAPLRADTLKVPAEFDTIQAAVDVAGLGDVVLVSKGVYDENVVVATSGITLKGKGASINGRYQGNCITVNASDVSIEGFTLVNGGGAPPVDGENTGGLLYTGTGADISKLTVNACEDFAIFVNGTGTVDGCKVDTCLGDGITITTDNPTNSTVSVISKNTVTHCQDGIVADEGPFSIEKNTCTENNGDGLVVTIPPPVNDGASIAQTSVSKNTLDNNHDTGLFISQAVNLAPGVLVEKNTVENNDTGCVFIGFFIDGESNTIQDNALQGVALIGTSCTLTKNKIKGNGRDGVLCSSADAADGGVNQGLNVLQQNTLQDNGGDGVHITSANNEVHDSTIKGNLGDGIDIDVGADSNSIMDNKITDNGHDGIDNSGLDTEISGNTSKNNGGADIAGAGDGPGTVATQGESGNKVSDDSDITTYTTLGELDLGT
ncbi:MAG TPA: right-handed parallel beta-helix repeat-containing protein [Planctomycetota bacterium]|nr:right-handed parallel beta-helix repeat-containing protein [Planctomycetota bacterium]